MNYPMISVDDHIDLAFLPADLWTTRLNGDLAERGPKVAESESGDMIWVCDGRTLGPWSGGLRQGTARSFKTALERAGVQEPGVLRPTIPELRLSDMDRDGVEASVMFGPVNAFDVDDPRLRMAIHRAYNDWLAEFCASAPRRLFGVAMVPAEDPEGAAEEVRRLARAADARQVSMHVGRATTPVYEAVWEPFWSALEENNMIASFHVVLTNRVLKELGTRPSAVFEITKDFVHQFLDPFVGLFAHGVLERHPGVKLVLAESGMGWLPWVVQELDYRFQRLVDNRAYWETRGGIGLAMKPSEVFRRQVYVTFQDDEVGLELLRFFGEENVLWASDYPHPDSTWPDSRAIVARQMQGLPPVTRRRILRDNAVRLYGL
jgi:predicted TIM-barrel fold metal-dependent hydrolase